MATFNLFWNNYSLPNYIPSLYIYNQAVKRSSPLHTTVLLPAVYNFSLQGENMTLYFI